MLTRIAVCGELLAGFVTTVSRVLQTDIGEHAERQQLLLAIESLLEAPPLAALGLDQQEKASAIE